MKKLAKHMILPAVLLLAIFFLSSCGSTAVYPGGQSVLPVRYLEHTTLEELNSGRYEILGDVYGEAKIDAENPEKLDSHKYGRFLLDETSGSFERSSTAGTDPYDVSIGNALYELIANARSIGAHFVVYPSYTVEFTDDGYIVTKASAVAVRLLPDSEMESL